MKGNLFLTVLLFSAVTSYSQGKGIVGSWLYRDSINTIQFFVKSNGTIERRTALANEYVWNKTPQTGTYTFGKDQTLVINWADKTVEKIKVKFLEQNAEFHFANQKEKPEIPYTFLRIVDEEVIADK